tara:strand:+ start:60 stop:515 length:456 start_codon:yes stop_codon:yes gene_type:complete
MDEFVEDEKKFNKFYYQFIADIYDFSYDDDSVDAYILYPLNIENNFMNDLFEEKLSLIDNDHTYHTYKDDHNDINSLNKVHKINNILEKIDEIKSYSNISINKDKFYSSLISQPIKQTNITNTNTTSTSYIGHKHLMIVDILSRYLNKKQP